MLPDVDHLAEADAADDALEETFALYRIISQHLPCGTGRWEFGPLTRVMRAGHFPRVASWSNRNVTLPWFRNIIFATREAWSHLHAGRVGCSPRRPPSPHSQAVSAQVWPPLRALSSA